MRRDAFTRLLRKRIGTDRQFNKNLEHDRDGRCTYSYICVRNVCAYRCTYFLNFKNQRNFFQIYN